MKPINDSDTTTLTSRAISTEGLAVAFKISSSISNAITAGQHEVKIDYHDEPEMLKIATHAGIIDYLTGRGYKIESRDTEEVTISWAKP